MVEYSLKGHQDIKLGVLGELVLAVVVLMEVQFREPSSWEAFLSLSISFQTEQAPPEASLLSRARGLSLNDSNEI
jgi:hypothetical protein